MNKTLLFTSTAAALLALTACGGGGGGGGGANTSTPVNPLYNVIFNASNTASGYEAYTSNGTDAGTGVLFPSRTVESDNRNKPLDSNGQIIFDAIEPNVSSTKYVWVTNGSTATKLTASGFASGIEPLDYKSKVTHKNKQYFLEKNFNLIEVSGASAKSVAKFSISTDNTSCLGSTTNGKYKFDVPMASDGVNLFISVSPYYNALTYNYYKVYVYDSSVSAPCKVSAVELRDTNGSTYNGSGVSSGHHGRLLKVLRANNVTYLAINGDLFTYDSATRRATLLQGSNLGYFRDVVSLSDGTVIAVDTSNYNGMPTNRRLFLVGANSISGIALTPKSGSGLNANNVWFMNSASCDNYFMHKDKIYARYSTSFYGGSNYDIDLVQIDKNGEFQKVTYGNTITTVLGGGSISTPPLKNICGQDAYSLSDAHAVVKVKRNTNSQFNELWVLDVTNSNTPVFDMIKDIRSTANPAVDVLGLVDGGKKLAFTAVSPAEGKELWITDGTTANTAIVKDIASGTANGIGAPSSSSIP